MKVKKSIETPDGSVTFEGELNSDEVDLILGVGLNFLLQQGAVPFKVLPKEIAYKMQEPETDEATH